MRYRVRQTTGSSLGAAPGTLTPFALEQVATLVVSFWWSNRSNPGARHHWAL